MALRLSSSAFESGGKIPKKHTCDGDNASPSMQWSGAPRGAKSFVLVCTDPDAPGGVFHHWAIFDIRPDRLSLEEACSAGKGAVEFREAKNDFGKVGYGGPCPPHGHGPHHYHFRLSALRAARLDVSPSPSCREIIDAAAAQALESAEIIGVYER